MKIFKFLYPMLNRLSILSHNKSFIGPEMMHCAPSNWMEVITVLSPKVHVYTNDLTGWAWLGDYPWVYDIRRERLELDGRRHFCSSSTDWPMASWSTCCRCRWLDMVGSISLGLRRMDMPPGSTFMEIYGHILKTRTETCLKIQLLPFLRQTFSNDPR